MMCLKCKTQQPRTAFRRKYKPYCWSCVQDYVNKFGAPPRTRKPSKLKAEVLRGYAFCRDCESLEPAVIMDANAFGKAIRKNCDSYREFLQYLIDTGFPDSHYVLCEECYHECG